MNIKLLLTISLSLLCAPVVKAMEQCTTSDTNELAKNFYADADTDHLDDLDYRYNHTIAGMEAYLKALSGKKIREYDVAKLEDKKKISIK